MENNFNPNDIADMGKKLSELMKGDFLKHADNLQNLADQMAVEKSIDSRIGEYKLKIQVSKNGQITISPSDKKAVDLILNLFSND